MLLRAYKEYKKPKCSDQVQESKKTGAGFKKMRLAKIGLFVGSKCFFNNT